MGYLMKSSFTMERGGQQFDITMTELPVKQLKKILKKEQKTGVKTPLWEMFELMEGKIKHAETGIGLDPDEVGQSFFLDVFVDYNDFLAKKLPR